MQMNQGLMTALSGATSVMANANENMNVTEIRDTLKNFTKEMERAGMQSEMQADAMDMMADPSEAADAEDVYNGILGEIGLAGAGQIGSGPQSNAIKGPAVAAQAEEAKADADDDMEARLAALRM